MGIREEIDLEVADQIVGGAYVNSSMTIGQIIGTDRNLSKMLTSAGIPVTNKALRNQTLDDVAAERGINVSVL